MPSITLDNRKSMSYDERGSGPPLVLLHGFPLDSRMWVNQVDVLADRYRVIVPDLPGFGRSKSDEPFTLASLAQDVHTLLTKLGGALPCALAGLSMGGYIALAFVKKYPNDLRALLLLDTKAEGDTAEGKEKRNKMIELVRAKGSSAVAEQMLPLMISKESASNAALSDLVKRMMNECPAKTIEHALLALRDRPDQTALLPSIAVPTLIVVGENDAITPKAVAESMNQAIPRSKLAIIPGAGHLSPIEKPNDVNRAIRDFLAER